MSQTYSHFTDLLNHQASCHLLFNEAKVIIASGAKSTEILTAIDNISPSLNDDYYFNIVLELVSALEGFCFESYSLKTH